MYKGFSLQIIYHFNNFNHSKLLFTLSTNSLLFKNYFYVG